MVYKAKGLQLTSYWLSHSHSVVFQGLLRYGRHVSSCKNPGSFLHVSVSSWWSSLIYRWAQDMWRYGLSDWFLKGAALISINITKPLMGVRHQIVEWHILCHLTWCSEVIWFIPVQLPTNVPRDPSNETATWACARDLLNGRNWKCGFIYEKIEFNGTSGHLQWILIVCWWEMLRCSPVQHLSQRAISVCPVRFQVLHLYSLSLPGCWLSNAFFFPQKSYVRASIHLESPGRYVYIFLVS